MYRKFKNEGFNRYPILPPISADMGCCASIDTKTGSGSDSSNNGGVKLIPKESESNTKENAKQLTSYENKSFSAPLPPPAPVPPPVPSDEHRQNIKKRISTTFKREKTNLKTDFKKIVKKASDLLNSNLDKYTEQILRGKITLECPPTAKIVRIFTSSTFTDTRHERNYLMENTYPKLKEFCQDLGYEFQVVDMRWGVRDEATDDHMTTELCLREVDLCNKLSTGPSFVTFLSHKYGYRDLPREIEAEEFEKLFEVVKETEVKNLLTKWFQRDDNSVPSTYVLQPISSRIPEFKSDHEDKKLQSKKQWNSEREKMREGIVEAAKQVLSSESSHKYLRSVTETEIDRGLLHGGERAYWFDRNIIGIENIKPSDILRRYKECMGKEDLIKESQQLLKNLRDKKLKSLLPHNHIHKYEVNWSNKGIDPANEKSHETYIQKLARDFEKVIKQSVKKAILQKEVNSLNTPLYQEVFQHIIFCQEKCKAFHGREETFNKIKDYMNDSKCDEPLIVHGESGSGKTSIMAMAVKNTWTKNQTTIIRFLGTTPDSSNIGALLLSIINQIRTVYNQDFIKSGMTLKELSVEFANTLDLAIRERPLLVVLDSLDQLDTTGGARQLFWLPQQLPRHVKMILSTLPEPEYECFPRLQAMFDNSKRFLPVSTLSNDDVEGILNKWLESNHRKLQEHQLKAVINSFHQCPIPLFLKLAFDEACRWKSFTPENLSVLKTTVRLVINDLFNRIELLHGELLVSRALGYLTLSSGGLTEAELEDILSCDDDVLNDVYTYWTPPVRRLPPLILVRIKAELGQYFVDRGADGVRVFYWYHRQFIEAANDKYCSDPGVRMKMHGVLADYFSGVWSNGKKKPYTTKSGEDGIADRFVAAQPIKLGDSLNLRKLNNLPHHRLQADQKQLLKSECLCNFDFILHKLKGSGLRPLLDDFFEAKQKYEEDEDIKSICDALQLSQHSLQYNPNELPSQLIGRLQSTKGLEDLLKECKQSPFCYLLPNKSTLVQPGGSLLYCIAPHTNDIYGLDLNKTGDLAVTCAYDNTVKLITVKSGKLLKSFDIEGQDPEGVRFCNNGKTLIVSCDDFLLGIKVQTGVKKYCIQCDDKGNVSVSGKNNELLGIFSKTILKLYDADSGNMLRAVECPFFKNVKNMNFGTYCPCIGSERYMAIVDSDSYKVIVFDTQTNQFLHMTNIFEPFIDSDGDTDQHTVDAMVITPDEKHIIVSSMMTNDLMIYNITDMKLVREIKGESKDSCDKYKMTPDGKFLYFPFHNEVIAFDMEKGERIVAINHPTNVENVSTLDMNTFVTTGDDRIVRVWDRSRTDGDSDRKTNSNRIIGKFMLCDNARFITTSTKDSREEKNFSLEVYDLFSEKVIKKDKLNGTYNIQHLVGSRYIINSNQSVAIVDLNTGDIVKLFKGIVPKKATRDLQIFPSKQEFCIFSRGRKNVKIINIESENCEIIQGCGERMEDMVINRTATKLACSIKDCEEVVFFDLVAKKCLYEYKASMIEGTSRDETIYSNESVITDDGKYFIHRQDMIPPSIKRKKKKDSSTVTIMVVWNIEEKKVHQYLSDDEYIIKYDSTDMDVTYDVSESKMLNQTTLVSTHDDYIIRLFNIEDGTLIKRLYGHNSNIEIAVNDFSPFFLTCATWSEENAIRVWDKDTHECIASYCMESNTDHVQISPDGYRIIVQEKKSYPVYFEIFGGSYGKYKPKIPMDQFEKLFISTDVIKEIDIPNANKEDTFNDGDEDPEEPESESETEDDVDDDRKNEENNESDDLSDINFSDLDNLDDIDSLGNLDNLEIDESVKEKTSSL